MENAPPGTRPLLVTLHIPVQTYDIDFAGHVNNVVYVRWLEDLRLEMLRQYYPPERVVAEGVAGIVHSTNIVYKRSVEFLDKVSGIMWCPRMGRATMTLEAEICVKGVVYAHAIQRIINLRVGSTKPVRIHPDLVAAWHAGTQQAKGA
jgi:acyl-CoA thioester hydrolase